MGLNRDIRVKGLEGIFKEEREILFATWAQELIKVDPKGCPTCFSGFLICLGIRSSLAASETLHEAPESVGKFDARFGACLFQGRENLGL